MQELRKPISRITQYRGWLTVVFRAWKCLLLIGFACWGSQEAIRIARRPWGCLEVWIRVCTFYGFFQVLFLLLHLLLASLLVCTPFLCTEEWIRVVNVITIFLHHCFWFGFDTPENLAKNRANSIFCAHQAFTRIQSLANWIWDLKQVQKSWVFNALDFFMICFSLNWLNSNKNQNK